MKWVDKIYIISLPESNIRKDNIWNDLLSAGFDENKIEWVEAINGNDLDIDDCLRDNTISTKFRDPNGILTKSIYGCALSHQKVYQKFIKTSDDIETALVLEDDASLTHTALRTLISDSPAYDMFIEDKDNIDWGVIQLGSWDVHMDYINEPNDSKILKRMNYPKKIWAAHSYIINKESVHKLIENNTPIQYAADTNIHISDVTVYCPPVSYFLQKVGKHNRWLIEHLQSKFLKYVVYDVDEYGLEYQSKTFNGDLIQKEEHLLKPMHEISLSKAIDAEKITFESFETGNGDTIEDWVTIHLKEENL
jgi:GR25 family glycosyltransferase involved in LPS biosynthesis